ncbi:peptidoglycan DD-metalloendopeptidase family protein [Alteromonas sp. ASW11-36]|uniref:Peptidoglycan DD-metalloendopeptidase family protein n=1 Tax=Alteromonas arenosi TaxID=3055817 RepID=A0ABT7T1A0_9ALTE|nr:peptidoglycan DD-metalloendopeptidase family protein [Alteromonas sp. ASW11-36]MDM7861584.1 peptidoglycan DD-metalloendopeptidase family protein [Alteromonas sp. ASW11-36]
MPSLLISSPVAAQQTEQELEQIQQQIEQTQQQLREKQAQAKSIEQQLKQAEVAISDTTQALTRTRASLATNRTRQTELLAQQTELESNIEQQQQALAAQIKSAYMAGNYDYAKILLNQEDAGTFERVLAYYQYVSNARRDAIEAFRADIKKLEQVKTDITAVITELNQLLATQSQQQARLTEQQQQRETALQALNRGIQTDAERVEQLQASAEALLQAIEQARIDAQQRPTSFDGLTDVKGQLAMPADGRFRRLFGDRRQGQVRWTGVIIEGSEGSPIRAVHPGRVLYADWLKGFGLVTIVDHGDGYMSVYGHSQALLTQPGDVVVAGQTIGLVGRSGGQASPNLYFEIRHKGKALNPSAWLKWR